MRTVASALLVTLTSCSFTMRGLDPNWDGRSEPKCDGSSLVWADRLIGVGLLLTAGAVGAADPDHGGGAAIAVPMALLGAMYEVAAVVGARRDSECRSARVQWFYSTSITQATPPTPAPPTPTAPTSAPTPSPAPAARAPAATGERPWVVGVSAAEQALALALFGEGNEAYVQRRYAEALAKYKQAIVHWDHPAIRFNMVVCLMALGQPVEARYSLDRSLAFGVDPLGPDVYAQAVAYRTQLDRVLVALTLDCPEPDEVVMLDGELAFTGPGRISRYLLPGMHQVAASKRGFLPAAKQIELVIGKPQTYVIQPQVDPRSLD